MGDQTGSADKTDLLSGVVKQDADKGHVFPRALWVQTRLHVHVNGMEQSHGCLRFWNTWVCAEAGGLRDQPTED